MKLVSSVQQLVADMTRWRHELHAIPELGFEEARTAAFVAETLRSFGLDVTEGVGGTGVVGTLRGRKGDGPSLGLRAELDALPIHETRGLAHASKTPNRMHACGHDGHMAMLLGAAKALSLSPDFSGVVHFIFQPAEEGLGGAKAMIADGLFDRFPCDEIYAAHNCERPLGAVEVHHGVVAASADKFTIELKGRGGHAAYPHLAANPLPAAAGLLLSLQSLPARINSAMQPAVVTVASIHAGEAFNVIPESVRMNGTVRALDKDARAALELAVRRQVEAHAQSESLEFTIDYVSLFGVTANHAAEADHVIAVAGEVAGREHVNVDPPAEMGSEDFCYMLDERPGCYFLLGQGDVQHAAAVHDPHYDFNDKLLPIGASLWVRLVEHRLGGSLAQAG
ncbi:amidohydrolase [Aestuariivirga sp.]|uniref:amidohydrolase n=1 Tax=Aestuariivirga sp. TaxID=2650926 RepID=UPI003BACE9D2